MAVVLDAAVFGLEELKTEEAQLHAFVKDVVQRRSAFAGRGTGLAVPFDPTFPIPKERTSYRGSSDYVVHAYQYAYSSFTADMQPAMVAYPTSKDEIVAVLKWAKKKGIAVAVRTGGHQYCGASSTTGSNILLDLSESFPEVDKWNEAKGTIRLGVSHALEEFIGLLQLVRKSDKVSSDFGVFIPTGQCSHVHLGGHFQTGGYGQMARAHGLFGDYVDSFELITGDGIPRTISRHSTDPSDMDLYYGVLGGSPGNMGIVTHITIKPMLDSDHPNSRGLKCMMLYSKEKFRELLDVLVGFSEDVELPGDFDYCVSMASWNVADWMFGGVDEEMRQNHPQYFGNDQGSVFPQALVVYAQWSNIGGAKQRYEDNSKQMDRVIKAIGNGPFRIYELKPDVHTPMSVMANSWVFTNVREWTDPFVRRTYQSNRTDLGGGPGRMGWAEWMVGRIEWLRTGWNGCHLNCQFQHWGGKYSKFRSLATDRTAYSWRADLTIGYALDVFYDSNNPIYGPDAPRQTALHFQEQNDRESIGSGKVFCDFDRRVLWGSFGDTAQQRDMAVVWPCYYETREKYEKLCRIRLKFDPDRVLVPNAFSVGGARPAMQPGVAGMHVTVAAVPDAAVARVGDESLLARYLQQKRSVYLRKRAVMGYLPFNVTKLRSQTTKVRHDHRRTALIGQPSTSSTIVGARVVSSVPEPLVVVGVSAAVKAAEEKEQPLPSAAAPLTVIAPDVRVVLNKRRRIFGSDSRTFTFHTDSNGEAMVSWHSNKAGETITEALAGKRYSRRGDSITVQYAPGGERVFRVAGPSDRIHTFEEELKQRGVKAV